MTSETIIRALTSAEAETLVGWARVEGWNPGLADAPALHAADPQGFIGCFVEGRFAAGISAVRYGSDFGFIGLYISHPDFRGKGYGRKVWDAGMAHLDGRTIGLDGVPEQQANYRSMGFEPVHDTFRWTGSLSGLADSLAPVTAVDHLPAILGYDRNIFPAEREVFLTEWLAPPRVGKAIIREGSVEAYAVCRECHEGYKIGPLFADNATDAGILLASFASQTDGQPVNIDVPAYQTAFAGWLAELGFSRGFTTARMYRGAPPVVRLESIFGITTLELG